MSIIIFIVILAVLVFVHELGHFLVAKRSGIRVDEFGIGFPPKLFSWKRGETVYSLNIIPFGGFVKIHGEDPNEESLHGKDKARSFANKNRGIQAAVLVAGVAFNILFAWLLISIGYMSGMPAPASGGAPVKDAKLVITSVLKDSPAEAAGLKAGDAILYLESAGDALQNGSVEEAQRFIADPRHQTITILHKRGTDATITASVKPTSGIIADKQALGITMDTVGILKLPVHQAVWEGGKTTIAVLEAVTVGLWHFIVDAFGGDADLSQVTGPVGIVGLVGDARELGFIYILSFAAFISLNLAVINLIPFPALDGGRLLFVAIEAVKRSRINPKVANALNLVGFVLLLALMAVVTYNDIVKLT